MKAGRRKCLITLRGSVITLTAGFLSEMVETIKHDILKVLKGKKKPPSTEGSISKKPSPLK